MLGMLAFCFAPCNLSMIEIKDTSRSPEIAGLRNAALNINSCSSVLHYMLTMCSSIVLQIMKPSSFGGW